jgi:hypothetical protein
VQNWSKGSKVGQLCPDSHFQVGSERESRCLFCDMLAP